MCVQLVERKAGRIWEEKRESVKRGTDENKKQRRGGVRGKWDALLEAPCHEILIIYLHGYQQPSHCLYILFSHPSFLLVILLLSLLCLPSQILNLPYTLTTF